MSQIDFILGPADLTIHRVTGWDHPSVDQSQDQAETLSRRAFTLKWRCCLDERMDLEISRITDCASWHTVVGMEYSTEFDKCSSPVNWVEPKFRELQTARLGKLWLEWSIQPCLINAHPPFIGKSPGFFEVCSKTKKRLRDAWVLVCPEGIEPPTHSLEGCCSIQLSYGQVRN